VCVHVQAEYSNCVKKLEKDLVSRYQLQFENLFKAEAPTWETHGNLMVITWFLSGQYHKTVLYIVTHYSDGDICPPKVAK